MNRARLGLLTGTHAINDLYQGLVPALLPFMVLERGYSVLTTQSGQVITRAEQAAVGAPLKAMLADGVLDVTVTQPKLL